jgi:hypothetical protein
MKQTICDVKGCMNNAQYSMLMPRNIYHWITGGKGNVKILPICTGIKMKDTDLCEEHYLEYMRIMSNWFKDIYE